MTEQVLAQQSGDIGKDGNIRVIEAIARNDPAYPKDLKEREDHRDPKPHLCAAGQSVKEGLDDQGRLDLPAKAEQRNAEQVAKPEARSKSQHLPNRAPGGEGRYFVGKGSFGHSQFPTPVVE